MGDLESSEGIAYGEAFTGFKPEANGLVPLDNDALRCFLAAGTSIPEADLDLDFVKCGALDAGGLSQEKFLQLCRDNAIDEGATIEEFLGASNDGGVTVSAEDCRSRLLAMAQRRLGAQFTDPHWEQIFSQVMVNADVKVPMEQWIEFSKQIARTVRVCQLARIT